MRRRMARFVFVTLLGGAAGLLGVLAALILTPPGRDLLARTVSSELSRVVSGSVDVGSISGSFLYDLTLERLVVRDTAGVLLADLPRVRVGYRLPNLLAGRFVLSRLRLDQPIIQLIKHRNGRMNYEEVLRLGRSRGREAPPLIEFREVEVRHGTLRVALPWSPPSQLNSERARDSALAAERRKPGRVIEPSPEGLRRVVKFEDLTAALPRLRISTPDSRPFTIDLDSLAARVSDPQVALRDAAGRIRFAGDSVVFSLHRGALPHTRFSGGGAVTWPRDTALFDFQFVVPRLALADFRWISPDFPDLVGRATVSARSESGSRTAYALSDLRLQRGGERVQGELTALDDRVRGIGVRNLRLALAEFDLDRVRPFAPRLPFHGTVSGTVEATGFLDDLDAKLDVRFADAKVPGRPVTHLVGDGRLALGGPEGLVFRNLAVRESDIDLGTVRRLAPAVVLRGRLEAQGTVDGPLHDVVFRGVLRHRDDPLPASVIDGTIRLDTRTDTLALGADVALDPLSFAGIRRAFPSLTARGSLVGRVRLDGPLSRLALDGSVSGEIGTVEATGVVEVRPPRWGADSLRVAFRRLDLAALRDTAPATSLNGRMILSGVADSGRVPEGDLALGLGPSLVRGFRLDTLWVRGSVRDGLIALDTLDGRLARVTVRGSGTLGWRRPGDGAVRLELASDTLGGFDSLLTRALGLEPDTSRDARPLAGSVRAAVTLGRSLDSLAVEADLAGRGLEWRRVHAPRAAAVLAYESGARPRVALRTAVDTLVMGTRNYRDLRLEAHGLADSLAWSAAGAAVGDAVARVAAAGRWERGAAAGGRASTRGPAGRLGLDSLRAELPAHTWRLEGPATITLGDSAPAVTPLVLAATDGSGRISLEGRIPGDRPGALRVDAFGVDLHDVYALTKQDTTGPGGSVGLTLEVRGSAREPEIVGNGWLEDAVVGTFQAPFAHALLQYRDQRLTAHGGLYRTGAEVLEADAELPLDLGFRDVKRRQLDGPLSVKAHADSADLGFIQAVLGGVRDVEGKLVGEATIGGTWSQPQVSGYANLVRGAMTIPGIGVRYGAMLARAEFRGDSLLIPYALATSGRGTLQVTGGIRLENLSRPLLNLDLEANQFLGLDIKNFLTVTVTGNAALRGPILNATATGRATVNAGVLYFADILNKQVIDLEDPVNAALVDTTLIRRARLGPGFSNRFLDSLTVSNLQLDMGPAVFLRSTEANIQLAGQITLNKVRREYRPVGTLETVRGTYTLTFPLVSRDFTVQRGTVRYFGTPDLNAELDIAAQHVVRTIRTGEEIPVVAHITGTLQVPKVELEGRPGRQLSETDLVSYLVTGAPAAEAAAAGQFSVVQNAVSYLASAATGELERFFISDIGIPIDYLEIRPSVAVGNVGPSTLGRVAVGWRIGSRAFMTVSAGFCDPAQIGAQNLGASVQYRFARAWRVQTSLEPTLTFCSATGTSAYLTTTPYQIGADVIWEREF